MVDWLEVHARDLTLAVRDGTVSIDMPSGSPLKLDGSRSTATRPPTLSKRGSRPTAACFELRDCTSISPETPATAELEFDGLDVAARSRALSTRQRLAFIPARRTSR
jgi:hypothetical protein